MSAGWVEKSLEIRRDLRTLLLGWFRPSILVSEKARLELNIALRKHWPDESPIEVYELIFESWETSPKSEPPSPGLPGTHQEAESPPAADTEGEASASLKEDRSITGAEADQTHAGGVSEPHNFIVFIDHELDVDWLDGHGFNRESAEAVSVAEAIGAKRCRHLPREQVLEFKRLVAHAIVNAMRGTHVESRRLSAEAAQFLKERTIERSRCWTLCYAHWQLVVFAASAWTLCRFPNVQLCFSALPSGFWLAAAGGFLGAYLSVIQKAGSGEWDAASGRFMHVLEVITKLLAGFCFGGVAFAISQSAHAPISIKSITADNYSLFIFGFAAGLFERTIPKMVSSYSEKIEKTKL